MVRKKDDVVDIKRRNITDQMPEKNGVRHPRLKTQSGKVWKLADQLTEKCTAKNKGVFTPTPVAPLIEKLRSEISELNIRNQYSRWRKYHGITGRYV